MTRPRRAARRRRRRRPRRARARPDRGIDAVLDVRVDGGTIAALGTGLDANGHRVIDGDGLVLAPAFVDPHVHLRTPGREDEETIASGHGRGGRRRLLRDRSRCRTPIAGRRLDRPAPRAARARGRGGGGAGRVHGRDHDRPGRRAAHRDGRARRRRRGRVHRRRPPGRERRADAPRARVQRDHRPPARAPLRGAEPDAAAGTCTWAPSRPSSASAAGRRSARASASRASSRSAATPASRST